jgi:hypothetical protein
MYATAEELRDVFEFLLGEFERLRDAMPDGWTVTFNLSSSKEASGYLGVHEGRVVRRTICFFEYLGAERAKARFRSEVTGQIHRWVGSELLDPWARNFREGVA